MAFDVDAFRAAHRPWSFTAGGRTWVARHVSANAVLEYEFRAADALQLAATDRRRGVRAQVRALVWLLRHAFPWRPSYWLRGDPVKLILSLEPAERAEVLKDFFARLQGKTERSPLQTTNGTPSPGPTPLQT